MYLQRWGQSMPDSLILILLAILSIVIFVLWQKDSYDRGHEDGYNKGYRSAKNYYAEQRR